MEIIRNLREAQEPAKSGDKEKAVEKIGRARELTEEVAEKDSDIDKSEIGFMLHRFEALQIIVREDPGKAAGMIGEYAEELRQARESYESGETTSDEFRVDQELGTDDTSTIEAEDLQQQSEREFVEEEIERLQDQLQHLEEQLNDTEEE